jgi:hypothetical protein
MDEQIDEINSKEEATITYLRHYTLDAATTTTKE